MSEVQTEPAIVAYGRHCMKQDEEPEYHASLKRVFGGENPADFVILDSNRRGQAFLAACAAWAIDNGLLYNDENHDEGQTVVSSFRLTDKGKEEFQKNS